jgi:hypothetical protein
MPSNLHMEQSRFRKHPRAEKYINELNQALGSIWREVDMAGVLASQESFGALNAGRKPAKYKVGDCVCHYQPKTDPDGAPTKMLIPWVGPWRVEQVVRAKDVKMQHIDTGVEEEVHTSAVIPAPEEEEQRDYNDRYSLVRHLEDVPDRNAEGTSAANERFCSGAIRGAIFRGQSAGSIQWRLCSPVVVELQERQVRSSSEMVSRLSGTRC